MPRREEKTTAADNGTIRGFKENLSDGRIHYLDCGGDFILKHKPGVVIQVCNQSTREGETGGS